MTCSNEKSFIMDERRPILSLNLSVPKGKEWEVGGREINSQNTKQFLWDKNINNGVKRSEPSKKNGCGKNHFDPH